MTLKMVDYKMECRCYLNGRGYKVGRKYLYIVDVINARVLRKRELDDNIKSELAKIKAKYDAYDARREFEIENLIWEDV